MSSLRDRHAVRVDLGYWGESFYVTDEGRCGVTDCNGDAVELDPDQWRHVITLLASHLDAARKVRAVELEGDAS